MQLRALDEGAESVLQKRRPIARRDDQRDEISRGAQLSLAAVEVLESVGRCRGSEVVKIKRRQMARLPDELVAGVHAVRREEPETSVKKNCGGALEPLLTAELQRHHFQNALDKTCKQNDENDGGTACTAPAQPGAASPLPLTTSTSRSASTAVDCAMRRDKRRRCGPAQLSPGMSSTDESLWTPHCHLQRCELQDSL